MDASDPDRDASLNQIYYGRCLDIGERPSSTELMRFLSEFQARYQPPLLDLRSMRLGVHALRGITNLLALPHTSAWPPITRLNLYANQATDDGVAPLLEHMLLAHTHSSRRMPLTHLNLGLNELTSKSAMPIARTLANDANLVWLELGALAHESRWQNTLGGAPPPAKSTMMSENEAAAAAELIADELRASSPLHVRPIPAIAKALEHNTSLLYLGLACNKLGDLPNQEINELCVRLGCNRTLTALNLAQNGLGHAFVRAFCLGITNGSLLSGFADEDDNADAAARAVITAGLGNGNGAGAVTVTGASGAGNGNGTGGVGNGNGNGNDTGAGGAGAADGFGAAPPGGAASISHSSGEHASQVQSPQPPPHEPPLTATQLAEAAPAATAAAATAAATAAAAAAAAAASRLAGAGLPPAFSSVHGPSVYLPLHWLDLSYNNLPPKAGNWLAQLLSTRGNSLCVLKVRSNSLGPEGITAISSALQRNGRLAVLDVSSNAMDDEGAAALAEALLTNTSITMLNLANNQIASMGGTALGEMLLLNEQLHSLNLAHNPLGDSPIITIANALQRHPALCNLKLHSTKMHDLAGMALACSIEHNTVLRSLKARDNFLSAVTGDEFLRRLGSGNVSLCELDVASNHISHKTLKALHKMCARSASNKNTDLLRKQVNLLHQATSSLPTAVQELDSQHRQQFFYTKQQESTLNHIQLAEKKFISDTEQLSGDIAAAEIMVLSEREKIVLLEKEQERVKDDYDRKIAELQAVLDQELLAKDDLQRRLEEVDQRIRVAEDQHSSAIQKGSKELNKQHLMKEMLLAKRAEALAQIEVLRAESAQKQNELASLIASAEAQGIKLTKKNKLPVKKGAAAAGGDAGADRAQRAGKQPSPGGKLAAGSVSSPDLPSNARGTPTPKVVPGIAKPKPKKEQLRAKPRSLKSAKQTAIR